MPLPRRAGCSVVFGRAIERGWRVIHSPAGGLILISFVLAVACDGDSEAEHQLNVPSMDAEGLASGPYSGMHAKMEKTIFGIDIIKVDIRFGERTAERLEELVAGREYSSALADSVVSIVLDTRDALLVVDIEYGVDVQRFLEESRANLRTAADAGLIPATVFSEVSQNLGPWFEFLEARGLKEGDRLIYRIRGDTFRTMFITDGGQTLLDQTDPSGNERRLAILAGYLAPGTDLREDLIESLFED
jgi:hypothetical protein